MSLPLIKGLIARSWLQRNCVKANIWEVGSYNVWEIVRERFLDLFTEGLVEFGISVDWVG